MHETPEPLVHIVDTDFDREKESADIAHRNHGVIGDGLYPGHNRPADVPPSTPLAVGVRFAVLTIAGRETPGFGFVHRYHAKVHCASGLA